METHINALKTDIKYQTYIQELKEELSGLDISPSGNYIEHIPGGSFTKATTGRLDTLGKVDLGGVTKAGTKAGGGGLGSLAGKTDFGDLSKVGTKAGGGGVGSLAGKTDFGDLSKAGTKSAASDLAKKFDFGDLNKAGSKSNLSDLGKKFDADSLGKNIDEAAGNVDNISKSTAKSMKKGLDDVTEGTKDVGTKASKNIDNAGDEVKDLYKQAKKFDWDSAKKFANENKLLLIAGVAVTVIVAVSLAKFEELNDKPFNITKIVTDKDSGYIKIEYSPRQTLHEDDTIEITESNSTPKLLGTHKIYDLIDDSSLLIESTDITLETEGTKGVFIYKTTFGNMLQTVMRDTVGNAADIASKGVLQPVLSGALDIAKDTGGSIFDAIIPKKYQTALFWGCIGLVIISVLIAFFALYKNLT
jgi:hypothetical protein